MEDEHFSTNVLISYVSNSGRSYNEEKRMYKFKVHLHLFKRRMARSFHTLAGIPIHGHFLYCEEIGGQKLMKLRRMEKGLLKFDSHIHIVDEESYTFIPNERASKWINFKHDN